MAGQTIGNEGIERGVGALVHLLRELVAVDEAGDGLAHGLGLGGVGVLLRFAVRLELEVEGEHAHLTARALDDLHLAVLAKVLDVGGRKRAVGHIDLPLLHGHLQIGGIGEVLHLHTGVLHRRQPLVVAVLRIAHGLVELERVDLIGAGECLAAHDRVGIGDFVCREHLVVGYGACRRAHDLLERDVERHLRIEHDGVGVRGFNRIDVGEQRARSVRVVDRVDAVIRELHVLRVERVTVRELEAVLDLDGELLAVLAPRAVVGCDVRRKLGGVVILCVQEGEHLNLHGIGTVVVRTGRVERCHLVGGADKHTVLTRGIGGVVLHAAAGAHRGRARPPMQWRR